MNKMQRFGLVAAAALTLTGCGSSGSSTAGIDGTGSPPRNAVAVGTITAFGSVYVNGVRFDTANATFEIDGAPGTQDDLSIGQVVLVVGTLATDTATVGTASRIVFDDAVQGLVQSVDTAAGIIVVLGQTVHITADTSFDDSFDPASIDGIHVGVVVEVSGFRRSDGSVDATRIEPKPAGLAFETTGFATNVMPTARTFRINDLVVDYGTAVLADFPGGGIAAGDLVEVRGTTFGAGGQLLATRVEFKGDEVEAEAGDRLEIEGFVTRFVDATDFDVAGLPVATDASTVFEGGAAADLGLDIKVEAEGRLDADGVLVATKVDIRRTRDVRMAAHVDSVNAASHSFVALGVTVVLDALTRIEDKSDADVEPFSLADLHVGDYVEVRGLEFPAGSGQLRAGQLEREDPDTETELQGFVQSVRQTSLTILGVTIETDSATIFRDVDDSAISAAAFFAAVEAGSLVKASGFEVSDTIDAFEVELE